MSTNAKPDLEPVDHSGDSPSTVPGSAVILESSTSTDNPGRNAQKRGNKWDDVSRQAWHENKKPRTNNDSAEPDAPRKPKRKVACLVGYCGTGYHGMQLNPPNKTIEGTLFDAFVKVGAVSSDNADDPKKVAFLRAARTDKGVHAAVNVISLKMIIEDPDLLDKINAELPDQIRVWSILRTIKSFNPRSSCDSRIYEYLLPTSAFLPPPNDLNVNRRIREKNQANVITDNAASFWTATDAKIEALKQTEGYLSIKDTNEDIGVLALDKSIPDADKPAMHAAMRRSKLIRQLILDCKHEYRISPERLQLLREALNSYHGTRNFHNFTVGQTYGQANSKRVIRSFVAGEPFLINGTEWISLKVHGQSFMLHQIRKMVAMVVLIVRYSASLKVLPTSYEQAKINIPKAPSLGLLLERPIFDVYNKKAGESSDKDSLELGEKNKTVEDFKKSHLYDKIYAEEENDNVFYNFLSSLDAYASTGEFGYLFGEENGSRKSVAKPKLEGKSEDPLSEETTLTGAGIEE